jgi:hypothetical protein
MSRNPSRPTNYPFIDDVGLRRPPSQHMARYATLYHRRRGMQAAINCVTNTVGGSRGREKEKKRKKLWK